MALYAVYEPSDLDADLEKRSERLVFVKDGFSWPAFLIAPFWLLYHRMWLGLLIFFGAFVVLDLVLEMSSWGEAIGGWATLGLLFLFGMEANRLRRDSLERKGYEFCGMAIGKSREEAELSFFKEWLPAQRRDDLLPKSDKGAAVKAAAVKMGGARPAPSKPAGGGEIIGSFPNA